MAPKAKKSRTGQNPLKFDPEKLSEFQAEAEKNHADARYVLDLVSETVKQHGGLHEYMASIAHDAASAKQWADAMYKCYPPVIGVNYFASEWDKTGLFSHTSAS